MNEWLDGSFPGRMRSLTRWLTGWLNENIKIVNILCHINIRIKYEYIKKYYRHTKNGKKQ